MVTGRPEIFYLEFFSHNLQNLIGLCATGLSKIFQFPVLKHTVQKCSKNVASGLIRTLSPETKV